MTATLTNYAPAAGRSYQCRFDAALLALATELDAGGEFPDLTWKISKHYNIRCEQLEMEYDNRCAEGSWPPEDV